MATVLINKLLKTTESGGDTKPFFYLESKWLDDQLIVRLQDSQTDKCYQGTVTYLSLKETASELGEPFNDYHKECRLALTTYLALTGYTFKLDEEECIFKVWKRKDDSIPVLYMEIPLNPARNHYDILDSAIEQLQHNSKALKERVVHNSDDHARELLEDYRVCVEEKNQLEKTLLRKVSVLLNAKKQKICELEERLSRYKHMDATNNPSDEDVDDETMDNDEIPQSSRKRRPLLVDSESDNDDDFNVNTQPLTVPE